MSATVARPQIRRGATISADGRYRYLLTRAWDDGGAWQRTDPAVWIMLNPSIADETIDDPTIRRVIGFTRDWGLSAATVVNLYAWRATHPRELRLADDPVGPDNDTTLLAAVEGATLVVCAWGALPFGAARAEQVLTMLREGGAAPMCLGTTRAGHPRHPLYVRADTALQPLGEPR